LCDLSDFFMTFYVFYLLKNDVNVFSSKSNKQKK
jgi:hypothetical protein